MRDVLRGTAISRRDMALLAASAAAGAALSGTLALAKDKPQPAGLDEALKLILGEAKPVESKVLRLELPEIAENGNTVPFAISVDSPMTEKDYVKAVHIVAGGNPLPGIATFSFTPASGKASVSSRMRLARTQDVIAIAEMSDGRFLIGRRTVKVTIGGCGG